MGPSSCGSPSNLSGRYVLALSVFAFVQLMLEKALLTGMSAKSPSDGVPVSLEIHRVSEPRRTVSDEQLCQVDDPELAKAASVAASHEVMRNHL